MIKSAHIQNFQSHKDTFIEFGYNVNTFLGYSDSGKTAIIRAIRWAITNKPTGDAFRSTWGGDTIVTLTLVNGTVVRRTKGNSINEYYLKVVGEEELVFKAFGTDVPSEIVEALSFTDTNLQNQLDSPYLLSETPGQVAKHFNKIAKLEQIDLAIAHVQSSITKLNQRIATNTSNITDYKEAYKDWDYLKDFETDLKVLEKTVKSKDEMSAKSKTLARLIIKLEELEEDKVDYTEKLQHEETINSLLIYYKDLKELKDNSLELESFIYDFQKNVKKQEKLKSVLIYDSIVNKLLELYKDFNLSTKERTSFTYLVERITKLRTKKESASKSLILLEEEYHNNFPDVCPLCNSKIK